jgi:medium-chain acyl-[acyl-carrier-protein] hydrolase
MGKRPKTDDRSPHILRSGQLGFPPEGGTRFYHDGCEGIPLAGRRTRFDSGSRRAVRGAAAVKRLCRELNGRCSATAVRLPGREALVGDEPVTDLAELAVGLAGQIAAHAAGRRVLMYGHCAGAVVAYEAAVRLPPEQLLGLAVSGQQAPDRVPRSDAWRLPRPQFLAQVVADGYLPAQLLADDELCDLVEPALRADYEAVECRVGPLRVLDAPVLALLGREEHAVRIEDVRAWGALTRGEFRLRLLDGGHNLLLDQVPELAAAIAELLP